MAEAAGRRGDARVLLVSLAFLAASGFLGLHALATPGVLLTGKNAGFLIASAIGLSSRSGFAAASALAARRGPGAAILRERRLLLGAVVRRSSVWAVVALGTLPPLEEPITPEATRDRFSASWVLGMRPLRLRRLPVRALSLTRPRALSRWRSPSAWVLLSEAMVAIAISRNWHVSWWEWHLLMLLAFGVVARSVWRSGSARARALRSSPTSTRSAPWDGARR